MKKWLGLLMSCWIMVATAGPRLTMELNQANLTQVLQWLARETHHALLLSPRVQGVISLSLQNASINDVLPAILKAENLSFTQFNQTWYIAPLTEQNERLAERIKWQTVSEASAPIKTRVCSINYAKAASLAKLLNTAKANLFSTRGEVLVDERTNALILNDVPTRLPRLLALIKSLDVPVPQLIITALLVSVDEDSMRELGIDFNQLNTETRLLGGGGLQFVLAKLSDQTQLEVKLKALQEEGRAELISNPHLFTTNQQPAVIEAGEEVPYQEVSESGGTAVAFKKAVLGLQVTPQVLPRQRVLLHLVLNQDRASTERIAGMPSINTRHMQTNVVVPFGQTVILGGIYENAFENAERSLPGINAVPIVGQLLSMHSVRHKKRELLILVTPNMHE